MLGRHPRPRTQPVSGRKTGDVADLGHEHRGQDRPHPVDGLDGPIAPMVGQADSDAPIQRDDLAVISADQIA